MPDAYVYGLRGDVDNDCGSEAEKVAIMTLIVTRITDIICIRVYLANEINVMFQFENGPKEATNVAEFLKTIQRTNPIQKMHTFHLTLTIQ